MKSATYDETVVPSHGRGRRFDPFSAHHSTGVSAPSPGNAEQQQAEQSKSRRGADVEPRSAAVLDIPTDPNAFNRWLYVNRCWTEWPCDLMVAGVRGLHALMARQDDDWLSNLDKRRKAKTDWQGLVTDPRLPAYADHVGAGS